MTMYQNEQWYEQIARMMHLIRQRTLEILRNLVWSSKEDEPAEHLRRRMDIASRLLDREQRAEDVLRAYQVRAFQAGAGTLAAAQETLAALKNIEATLLDQSDKDDE
jgi:hypothetical protein